MNQSELEMAWNTQESEHIERTKSYDLNKIRENICAFANDLSNSRKAGIIFVGQNDDLACANLSFGDKELTALADESNLIPFPVFSVQQIEVNKCKAIAIIVQPSLSVPVRFKQTVFVRIGASTRKASHEAEQRLIQKQRHHFSSFELSAVRGATIDDLDLVRFQLELLPQLVDPDTLAENGRDITEWLENFHFINPQTIPTTLGILTIGKTPQSLMRCAYIEMVRVKDTELNVEKIIFRKKFTGTIIDQIKQIEMAITNFVETNYQFDGFTRLERLSVPAGVVRELVINGLVHRTYEGTNAPVDLFWFDDHIEIISPGGVHGRVTKENFGTGVRDYLNPELVGICKAFGFVEQLGSGLRRVKRELDRNGNLPPEFDISDQSVMVNVILNKPCAAK